MSDANFSAPAGLNRRAGSFGESVCRPIDLPGRVSGEAVFCSERKQRRQTYSSLTYHIVWCCGRARLWREQSRVC